jgi:ligand-binding sensor domain-containing protein
LWRQDFLTVPNSSRAPCFRIVWQLLLGAVPLVIAALLFHGWTKSEEQKHVPPGWMIIRPPGEVTCLLPDGDQIWAGGRDGINRVDRLTGKLLPPLDDEPRFEFVHSILKSTTGAVWIAHDGGVAVYEKGKWAAYGGRSGVPFGRAYGLVEDRDGRILVGTVGGIARWHAGRWDVESMTGEGLIDEINVLFFDRSGRLWAGSRSPFRGGLCISEGGKWKGIDASLGLPHPSVNSVFQDRDGMVWIATGFSDHGGAARMKPGEHRLTPFPLEKNWDGIKVLSLYEDTTGRMWIGLEYDGVLIFDGAKWKRIAPGQGLAGQEVKVVRQDAAGVFWLGTSGGLSRFDESRTALEHPTPQNQ